MDQHRDTYPGALGGLLAGPQKKGVVAKEGHYKTATIEKIFKALPETDLTPDEVRRPRPFPAPRPPASAQRRAPCGQMAIIMKAADPSGSGQIPKDFFRNMID